MEGIGICLKGILYSAWKMFTGRTGAAVGINVERSMPALVQLTGIGSSNLSEGLGWKR